MSTMEAVLLAVAVVSIVVALIDLGRPKDEPFVLSFPHAVSLEVASAARDAIRDRAPGDPIIVTEGVTVSRLRQ